LSLHDKTLSRLTPRGLRRDDAAAYVGVSPSKFDDWVNRGVMPKPKRIDRIVVWDRIELDAVFENMRDETAEEDTWADV
jgi:predicted DNA-binding transcriptional regulator AlpA